MIIDIDVVRPRIIALPSRGSKTDKTDHE